MQLNRIREPRTHEGAKAKRIDPTQELRRAVCSCFLWEREFYESGQDIAERIQDLVARVEPKDAAKLAIEVRTRHNIRHAPLLLAACLAKGRGSDPASTRSVISNVIQRADEMGEFLSLYAQVNRTDPSDVKRILSRQVKLGIADAYRKFDAYQLGKYNRKTAITLKDILRLCHPKPEDKEQSALWKRIIDDTLESPDTWEVALSAGADKKETFTRLLSEGKLGYLALLRNLRNMDAAEVDDRLMRDAILARKGAHRVLPFRYVAAAQACPRMEPYLDQALCDSLENSPVMSGQTIAHRRVGIDVGTCFRPIESDEIGCGRRFGRNCQERQPAGVHILRGCCRSSASHWYGGHGRD